LQQHHRREQKVEDGLWTDAGKSPAPLCRKSLCIMLNHASESYDKSNQAKSNSMMG
jgi:hypothetical protein